MRFTVTARSSTGAIVFEHASLLNALAQAMSMSASGMTEVRIADGSGPAHTPADLYRSMFGGHDDRAVSSEADAIGDVPLAA